MPDEGCESRLRKLFLDFILPHDGGATRQCTLCIVWYIKSLEYRKEGGKISMPKGPRGEKRPADTNAAAVLVARIATGEIKEICGPTSGRVRSGKAGGKARAESLSEVERVAIARKAANARWR